MGIEQARRAARKALERTYEGRATVSEYKEFRDPDTFLTDFKEVNLPLSNFMRHTGTMD